jgi:hypothetical protein
LRLGVKCVVSPLGEDDADFWGFAGSGDFGDGVPAAFNLRAETIADELRNVAAVVFPLKRHLTVKLHDIDAVEVLLRDADNFKCLDDEFDCVHVLLPFGSFLDYCSSSMQGCQPGSLSSGDPCG